MKWSEFIESFTSLVDSNKTLSTIAKFQYLKHSLKDSAASAIESLDFNEANYEIAKQILNERYNQPNRICEHHVKSLFCARIVENPCPIRIMELLDTFNSHLRSLQTLNRPVDHWDDLIVYLLISKLDNETKDKWYELAPNDRIANFVDLSKFLKARCSRLELMSPPTSSKFIKSSPSSNAVNNSNSFKSNQRLPRFHNSNVSHHAMSINNYYCVFCDKSSHSILRCLHFLKLSIADRISQVESKKLCSNCLKTGHVLIDCFATDTCKLCKQKHHTLLHESTTTRNESTIQAHSGTSPSTSATASPSSLRSTTFSSAPSSAPSSSGKSNVSALTSTMPRQGRSYVFLATALIEVLDHTGKPIIGRALLDSGSQLNFISRHFASKLRLPIQKFSSSIGGIGATSVRSSGTTKIELKSLTSNYQTSLEVMVLPSITDLSSPIQFDIKSWSIPVNLRLADPKFIDVCQIDILIGAEIYFDLLSVGQIKLGPSLPSLQNTVLGWIVSGRADQNTISDNRVSLLATSISSLEEDIERFWKLESVPEGFQNITTIDHPCDQYFVKNFSRDLSGRFIVRLPFTKMYRQIRAHIDDCNYQLIFWRNHPVTYGTSPASFLATRCLVQCANESIRSDMYVEDILHGSNSITAAHQLKSEITRVHESAGVELRKCCANSSDVFQFHVKPASTKKITKRIVISEIARLFDPLGFVASVVILGKLFVRKLWKFKVDWDEALRINYYYYYYWTNYREELSGPNNFSIPRYLFDSSSSTLIELHDFSNAKESAFGAVIYTCCCQSDRKYLMRFLYFKSRVAPLQKTILPGLELSAALLLTQLMSQIKATLNFDNELYTASVHYQLNSW